MPEVIMLQVFDPPLQNVTPAKAGVSSGSCCVLARRDPSLRWDDVCCEFDRSEPSREEEAGPRVKPGVTIQGAGGAEAGVTGTGPFGPASSSESPPSDRYSVTRLVAATRWVATSRRCAL